MTLDRLQTAHAHIDELEVGSAISDAFLSQDTIAESLESSLEAIFTHTGIESIAVIYDGQVHTRGISPVETERARQVVRYGGSPEEACSMLPSIQKPSNRAIIPIATKSGGTAVLALSSQRPGDLLKTPAVRSIASGLAIGLAAVDRRRRQAAKSHLQLVPAWRPDKTQKLHAVRI